MTNLPNLMFYMISQLRLHLWPPTVLQWYHHPLPPFLLFSPMYISSSQTPTLETASIIELPPSAPLCNCHPTSALTLGGFVSKRKAGTHRPTEMTSPFAEQHRAAPVTCRTDRWGLSTYSLAFCKLDFSLSSVYCDFSILLMRFLFKMKTNDIFALQQQQSKVNVKLYKMGQICTLII